MSKTINNSSAISKVEYTQILEVKFRSGKSYTYTGVPEKVYRDFMGSTSKGKFFQDYIRDRYSYTEED